MLAEGGVLLQRLEPAIEASEGTARGRREHVLVQEGQIAEERDVGESDAMPQDERADAQWARIEKNTD